MQHAEQQHAEQQPLPEGYGVDALRKKLKLDRHPVWFLLIALATLQINFLIWMCKFYPFVAAYDRSGKFNAKFWTGYSIGSYIVSALSFIVLELQDAMMARLVLTYDAAAVVNIFLVLNFSILIILIGILLVDAWLCLRCLKIFGGRLQEQGFVYAHKPVSTVIFFTLFHALYLHYRLRQCLHSAQEEGA